MTSPGYVCATCPDLTRVARRCPKPIRDPRIQRPPDGDPSCPVLEVPAWFWELAGLGASIEAGAVSPADVSGRAWQRAAIVRSALRDAEQTAQWEADRRRDVVERMRANRRG